MLVRLLILIGFSIFSQAFGAPRLLLPDNGIRPRELAIVINENDPLSVEVGELYAKEREIPDELIVRLKFNGNDSKLTPEAFAPLKAEVDRRLPRSAQALLLTWVKPYRVGCMSITSAFSLGFDTKYCSARQCAQTAANPYFNSTVRHPFNELDMRPSMMLGATSIEEARGLIERGLASEKSEIRGTAYLVSTSDKARNVRSTAYGSAKRLFERWIDIETPETDALKDKSDVMFYFTGLQKVGEIESNRFLPGAVADHLTSFGGQLTDSSQMSALEWLKAGATGSYGTVVEPCAHRQKFPDPLILMAHYLAGERLIEAYWKSVAWPGEGVFVGDPLAKPFVGYFARQQGSKWLFEIPYLPPGHYRLEGGASAFGPFKPVTNVKSEGRPLGIRLPLPVRAVYRLQPINLPYPARTAS